MESRNKEIILDNSNITTNENINENAAAANETAAFSGLVEINSFDVKEPDETETPIEVKEKKVNRFVKFYRGELFTKGFKILLCIFLSTVVIYLLSRFVPVFAEFWTRYPAQWIRFLLAKLTGWIPFSLAEAIIVSLPVLAIAYLIASSVSTKKDESNKNYYRWVRPMISMILVVLIIFFAGFGPAYGRYKLSENLGLVQKDVSSTELYATSIILSQKVKEDIKNVEFDTEGASIMPYNYFELREKINAAFEKYAAETDYISHFNSNPKPIALSKPMTYTHISGVYTFMTGESNINTNYPDFLTPFTMAHEMAHQRGIAREDEANFVAYLVCIGSDDAYVRYSAYTNMMNYMLSALNSADKSLYSSFVSSFLPKEIKREFAAYSSFFDEYRDSTASDVTGAVNNVFLQSQGQKEGTKSYGLVVDLAVAYYKQ